MRDKQGRKLRISDIARAAGVSPTAVSRYLNSSGYVSPEKSRAICQALEMLGAQTETNVQENRGRNRRLFAYLAPPYSSSGSMQFAAMSTAFSEAARANGYATKIYSINLSETSLIEALQQILSDHPSGILVPVVPMMSLDFQTQRFIQECDIPIVFCSEFQTPYSTIHSIIYNFDTGLNMSVTHLVQMGCRRLALLTPPSSQSKSAGLQQAAFLNRTKESSLLEKSRIFTYPWVDGMFAEAGYLCAKQAFSEEPDLDGIISWTDSFAAGILWYLYETGRRVPQDVKLVANNEEYAPCLCPPLTTYSFSTRELSAEAVDMLVALQNKKQLQNVRHLYITPIFTIRGSTDSSRLPECEIAQEQI